MTEVLKIEGLSAGYGPLRVIHDLDLVIHPGERVGIVGLNGHGKTTLFYAIAGLTGWQRGSILLNGKQIGRTRSQGPGAIPIRSYDRDWPSYRRATRSFRDLLWRNISTQVPSHRKPGGPAKNARNACSAFSSRYGSS